LHHSGLDRQDLRSSMFGTEDLQTLQLFPSTVVQRASVAVIRIQSVEKTKLEVLCRRLYTFFTCSTYQKRDDALHRIRLASWYVFFIIWSRNFIDFVFQNEKLFHSYLFIIFYFINTWCLNSKPVVLYIYNNQSWDLCAIKNDKVNILFTKICENKHFDFYKVHTKIVTKKKKKLFSLKYVSDWLIV
jgi:hypothetical protein